MATALPSLSRQLNISLESPTRLTGPGYSPANAAISFASNILRALNNRRVYKEYAQRTTDLLNQEREDRALKNAYMMEQIASMKASRERERGRATETIYRPDQLAPGEMGPANLHAMKVTPSEALQFDKYGAAQEQMVPSRIYPGMQIPLASAYRELEIENARNRGEGATIDVPSRFLSPTAQGQLPPGTRTIRFPISSTAGQDFARFGTLSPDTLKTLTPSESRAQLENLAMAGGMPLDLAGAEALSKRISALPEAYANDPRLKPLRQKIMKTLGSEVAKMIGSNKLKEARDIISAHPELEKDPKVRAALGLK